MSPDLPALMTAVLAWQHAGWMWLWGGLMVVVWAAILGTLAWISTLPIDAPRPPRGEHEPSAETRGSDLVRS
jgi:hypothetical protein